MLSLGKISNILIQCARLSLSVDTMYIKQLICTFPNMHKRNSLLIKFICLFCKCSGTIFCLLILNV